MRDRLCTAQLLGAEWGSAAQQCYRIHQSGRLVAIMGPSGSGKTTCLDVLAGRRRDGVIAGSIYVNGRSRSQQDAQEFFNNNTGYMLKLAEAFAVELTVMENLVYAALLRLPAATKFEQVLKRVDEVIDECGMRPIPHVRVGSATGGGISGGQKRKLMLTTEMRNKPALLFLDEPTSGLDATSSLQVMAALRAYCMSGRAVAVTMHQPRTEIFSTFEKLLLLSDRVVAPGFCWRVTSPQAQAELERPRRWIDTSSLSSDL
eukprot:5203072-Prymnesium_polylepis.1